MSFILLDLDHLGGLLAAAVRGHGGNPHLLTFTGFLGFYLAGSADGGIAGVGRYPAEFLISPFTCFDLGLELDSLAGLDLVLAGNLDLLNDAFHDSDFYRVIIIGQ